MITSLIREFRCFFWSQPGHAVEQLVKRSEIWNIMTLDHVRSVTVKIESNQSTISATANSHICIGNFISAGISYYKDYVSSERVWIFLLVLVRRWCWTNSRTLICDPWRSCGVAVKTILQNGIPRTPNSNMQYNLIRPGIINYKLLHMCMVNPHEIYEIKTTHRTKIYDICGSYSPAHYRHSDSASSGV